VTSPPVDLTVVVPVRNAASHLAECLSSVRRNDPADLIVVDGRSSDDSVEIARGFGARVLSDEGRGLPVARLLGAEAARTRWLALVDSDVVLADGALAGLLAEAEDDGWTALQAGLLSTSGQGYWGRALVHHHRSGRSRHWFGLVATVIERSTMLAHAPDERFASGEDIDLRWRLRDAGARVGVSRRTLVEHRFTGDDFAFAREQWRMDGAGLRAMVGSRGWRAGHLVGLPAAAAARGMALSLARGEPRWLPYYACYCAYNYRALLSGA
jgi:glycosyltransferase involved in cell wall biosynthesis